MFTAITARDSRRPTPHANNKARASLSLSLRLPDARGNCSCNCSGLQRTSNGHDMLQPPRNDRVNGWSWTIGGCEAVTSWLVGGNGGAVWCFAGGEESPSRWIISYQVNQTVEEPPRGGCTRCQGKVKNRGGERGRAGGRSYKRMRRGRGGDRISRDIR